MKRLRKLLVVSHVLHYEYQGELYAYGPYSREIDIWADLFPIVSIASPCRKEKPPGDCLPFSRKNISISRQLEVGGDNVWAKLLQILLLPVIVVRLTIAMFRADAIHVRCPGNLGLLGCVLGPLASGYRVAKFAGQWNGYRNETPTVRWQRWLLKSKWWGAPVTVYGEWPNQPSHVIPFFTSMMTGEQVSKAAKFATEKQLHRPLRILFSGRLAPEKRVDALIEALAIARRQGLEFEVVVVGDGVERKRLEDLTESLRLSQLVRFVGAQPFEECLTWNEWADCLVLPSKHSEGWPKVIAEAMCYGVVCIGVDHGQVGRMLAGRGYALHEGSAQEISDTLIAISRNESVYIQLSSASCQWAQQYSIDGLRAAIAALLTKEWNGSHIDNPV